MVKRSAQAERLTIPDILLHLKGDRIVFFNSAVSLQPFRGEEVPYIEKWYADREVTRYLGDNPLYRADKPLEKGTAEKFVNFVVENEMYAHFLICHAV